MRQALDGKEEPDDCGSSAIGEVNQEGVQCNLWTKKGGQGDLVME